MKFQVGDLVLIKECEYKPRLRRHDRLDFDYYPLHTYTYPHLKNTYGGITETINHRDAWEGESTEDDNVYLWYSQVDAKTYYFCENELTDYEVVK